MVKEDIDLNFETDRSKFCLSKEEGEKWRRELDSIKEVSKMVEGWKERDKNKDLYDKVANIKKLTIIELEKLLVPILEKGNYTKFQLSNPEIGKDVIVPFLICDRKNNRTERESEIDIVRIIKKAIKDTNWRLMSEGVSYRLGFLGGRLRGYEREEDLIKLVK
jgi:hypothetical protein